MTKVTNGAGIYRFEAVLPDDYIVTATATGFAKQDQKATVAVGVLVGRDFLLSVGNESNTVEVSSHSQELQTEDPLHVTTISALELAELPIAGQNSLNLILTAPGVARSNQGGSLDSGIGAVNGARARSNNFLIDGLQNNDISVAGPQFVITNNDELQEVSFQTSNFTAEYGRAGGAVISQVTKSGTNSLHGTVAEVFRTQLFNASTNTQRITYNNALAANAATLLTNPSATVVTPLLKPKFHENIGAFTIGGPIFIPKVYDGRDRTFFFGAGQFDRYPLQSAGAAFIVPTPAGYATLAALAPNCPNVAAYLALLGTNRGSPGTGSSTIPIDVPANLAASSCSGGTRAGQTVEVGQYVRTAADKYTDNNYLARLDHVFSQKQNIAVRYLYDFTNEILGGQAGIDPRFDIPYQNKTYSLNLNYIYSISNNLVNELRVGASRANIGFFPSDSAGLASTYPDITIAGGLSNLALSATFPQGRISDNYQLQDSMTFTIGRHAIRGGVDLLRQIAAQTAPFNSRGQVAYSASPANAFVTSNITGLGNFIDNYGGVSAGPVNILFGSGRYHPNLFTKSGYIQDTYKATEDLTLTFGIRYENFGQPANGFVHPAFVGTGDNDILSTAKVNADNNNFGPSVGFAYNPRYGNNARSLVLRGGYQVTYDTFFNNLLSNIAGASPNALANTPVPSASTATTPRGTANISNVLPSLVPVPLTPYTSQSSVFNQNIRNPYYHHFSFGIQQQFMGGVVMDLAYVGSLGRQLFYTDPINPNLPNATLTGTATQTTALYGTQALRYYANRGAIQTRNSGLTSNYHSLQLQVQRRAIKTIAGTAVLNASYTWSKNLDVITEVFGTNSSPQNISRPEIFGVSAKKNDYGPSDNDRRHVFTFTGDLQIRSPKGLILKELLGGWSVAPILTVQSGTPYTVINGFDRGLDGSTSFARPNIGNILAPINTRAQTVPTATCASGLQNPAIGTKVGVGCVTANDVRFVQVTTYSPTSGLIEKRNSNRTTRYLDLDTNILKTFKLTERVGFELRGEIFNVTNNQNFDTPSGNRNVTTNNGVNFLNTFLLNGGGRTMRVGGKLKF